MTVEIMKNTNWKILNPKLKSISESQVLYKF